MKELASFQSRKAKALGDLASTRLSGEPPRRNLGYFFILSFNSSKISFANFLQPVFTFINPGWITWT